MRTTIIQAIIFAATLLIFTVMHPALFVTFIPELTVNLVSSVMFSDRHVQKLVQKLFMNGSNGDETTTNSDLPPNSSFRDNTHDG